MTFTDGSPARGRLLADGTLGVLALGAAWLALSAGLAPVALAAFIVTAVGLEALVSGRVRSVLLETTDPVDGRAATLVGETANRMGLDPPTVVAAPGDGGITVLRGADGPTVLVAESLLADLDDEAACGVVAHELAHVESGHLGRFGYREPVAHLVGFAVAWTVLLGGLAPPLAVLLASVYLIGGVLRPNALLSLSYLLLGLGTQLVPIAIGASAGRREELTADDRAAALVGPASFARGLRHSAAAAPTGGRNELAGERPFAERRGPIARLTADHPTVERRLERLDVAADGPPATAGPDGDALETDGNGPEADDRVATDPKTGATDADPDPGRSGRFRKH